MHSQAGAWERGTGGVRRLVGLDAIICEAGASHDAFPSGSLGKEERGKVSALLCKTNLSWIGTLHQAGYLETVSCPDDRFGKGDLRARAVCSIRGPSKRWRAVYHSKRSWQQFVRCAMSHRP